MNLNLKTIKYYYLTTGRNDLRKNHIMDILKDYDLTEVNPILDIPKQQSGSIGYSRMIDAGIHNQNRNKQFQSYVMLEDDISLNRNIPENIEIPDDIDILYIGLSPYGVEPNDNFCSGRKGLIYDDVNNDIFRIYNMLSTHGVIVCSVKGATTLQRCVMEAYYIDYVWDNTIVKVLPFLNVYALKEPLVYQDFSYGGNPETKISYNDLIKSKTPKELFYNDKDNILSLKMMFKK